MNGDFAVHVNYRGEEKSIAWPAGAPVPSAGDMFVWQDQVCWVDDVMWVHSQSLVSTPQVSCFLSLVDDEGGICPDCGEVHA